MKKIRPIKNTWYDWLINYIPEIVISLFKTNTPKETVHERGKKLSKPKTQNKTRNPFILKKKKKIKDRIIRDIWTLFEQGEKD